MANFFYYDASGQKQGPVNDAQLAALVARGDIVPETQMETESGRKGLAGQIPGLNFPELMPPESSFPMAVESSGAAAHSKDVVIENLELYYEHYKLSMIWGIPLSLLGIGLLLLLYALVNWLKFLHAVWSLIPQDIARTKPDKAVAYSCIPIFCFYWNFVAVVGLAEDLNKALERQGLETRVNERRGLIMSVVNCWFFMPWVNFITGIVWCVYSVYYMDDMKNGAIALLRGTR